MYNNFAIYTDFWERNRITEATRNYIEFGNDLQPYFSIYFSFNSNNGIYKVAYNNQEPPTDYSKKEFEDITEPILAYCTDPKNYDMISWINFGTWIKEHIDEYIPLEEVGWPKYDDNGDEIIW